MLHLVKEQKMKAYSVANYSINDPDTYMQYIRNVRETLVPYGGRTIIADHQHDTKEGQPAPVVVAVEFPSMEKAQEWYQSDAYRKIVDFRRNSCTGWVTLCAGFSLPEVTP